MILNLSSSCSGLSSPADQLIDFGLVKRIRLILTQVLCQRADRWIAKKLNHLESIAKHRL